MEQMIDLKPIKEDVEIVRMGRKEVLAHQEHIYKFMNSLRDEKNTFSLSFEKVMSSLEMSVVKGADGRWLGMAGYRRESIFAIFFLVVHRDAQSMGLGRRLMISVLRHFPMWRMMLLNVTRSNLKARRLYDAYGFEVLHRGTQDVSMAFMNPMMKLCKPLIWLLIKVRATLKS
jgi:ribosomal protein S18 acetylase RimI-like enzyme